MFSIGNRLWSEEIQTTHCAYDHPKQNKCMMDGDFSKVGKKTNSGSHAHHALNHLLTKNDHYGHIHGSPNSAHFSLNVQSSKTQFPCIASGLTCYKAVIDKYCIKSRDHFHLINTNNS